MARSATSAPGRGVSLGADPRVGVLPLAVVGVLIAWWGWKQGAFFGVVFLPGGMILLAVLAVLLALAPWPGRLRGPARVALFALAGLSAWTVLSALWSPVPDIAISDAQQVLIYSAAFAVGLWGCLLLGRRMILALGPVAFAGAAVALATLVALWVSDNSADIFETDATLQYPLGYRNAAAAFFLTAYFPMIVLGLASELDWRLRALLAGTATVSLELAVLAQSRGSVFAIAAALLVLLFAHPAPLRVLMLLVVTTLPAVLALPWLLDVYQHGGGNTTASLDPLRTAATAMALTGVFAGVMAALFARADPPLALSREAARTARRGALIAAAAIVAIGALVVLTSEGGPAGFIDRQSDEFSAGSPDLSSRGSRFGLDLRSDRGDMWRVAIDDFTERPLMGEGAGGFRFSYLRDRESALQPEDPHSVEFLMASELGLPGIALLITFLAAAVIAVLRARRLGPSAAALAAGALAAGAYWFVHASVEWFWSYPALTMPAVFLLGAAAAPALLRPPGPEAGRRRAVLAVAAVLLAVSMVPLFLSERLTKNALRNWPSDLPGAYSDLDLAADLNPFSDRPFAAEAVIAEQAGEPQRALAALAAAQDRRPEEWTLYFLEARVYAAFDSAASARALERARALNPGSEEITALDEELGGGP